jgi:guanylate kinase
MPTVCSFVQFNIAAFSKKKLTLVKGSAPPTRRRRRMHQVAAVLFTMTALFLFLRPSAGFKFALPFPKAGAVTATRQAARFQGGLPDPVTTTNHSTSVLYPLIVCGPSGVGKGTIIAKFMQEMGGDRDFGFTVSHTTRTPREGEIHGVHYHFVKMEQMRQQINQGDFLEYAEVHGNLYGTSWASLHDVQNQGKRSLLDIDVQGVKRIKTLDSQLLKSKYLFISPPSLQVLQERLIGRGTESAESLERRTKNAREEVEYGAEPGNFDKIVVNESLDRAVIDFTAAVKELYNL